MNKYAELQFNIYESDIGENVGEFEWGVSRSEIFDRYYDAQEISEPTVAMNEFRNILKDDPEFIDAYNSLGWWEIDFHNYGNAFQYLDTGYQIGQELIPKGFKGQIIWSMLENRPFLRAMHGVGMTYLLTHAYCEAAKIFEKLLKYNPNDNQGIRALVIECYMATGEFKKIVKIGSTYPEDTMPDTLYGLVYANYYLGKTQTAEENLKDAVEYLPNVAKELLKTKHKEVKSQYPGSVVSGGEDEAYDYWERTRQYWTDPQLLKFIRNGIDNL